VVSLPRVRARLCALIVTIGALIPLLSGSARAAPLPADFFGVSSPDLDGLAAAARVPILNDQRAAGVQVLREIFDWSAIEPAKGSFDWTGMDSLVASAAGAGMDVLPAVASSPGWASSCPGASNPTHCPPANDADLGEFFQALIQRYGPDGSFWTANPTVPKRPITAWQVWNEPNLPGDWGGSPSAGAYVQMLQAVKPMIKAADPQAEVVAAGLPDSLLPGAIRLPDYVTQLYAAGGKGAFDTLALHIYDETAPAAVGLVEQVRQIMNAAGDTGTPIWVTEFGWASAGKPYRFTTDLAGQAADIDYVMGQLVARHEELGMRGVIEYLWRDSYPQSNTGDGWTHHLGLVFDDYSHKPSYDAYRSHAIHTTPPDTVIQSGPSGSVLPGPQSLTFSATEDGSDFECAVDGGSYAPCRSPFNLDTLAPGSHTFAVRATDPYGNTDPAPATATWTVAGPPPALSPSPAPRAFDPAALASDAHLVASRLARLDLRKLARMRSLAIAVAWPASGSMAVTLRGGTLTLAGASVPLHGRGAGLLRLRFSSKGRRLIARSRRLKATVTETFTPSSPGDPGQISAKASFVLRTRGR
jgi:polysaccharide biosynthesis protein PslG